jgi:hypothetical protein
MENRLTEIKRGNKTIRLLGLVGRGPMLRYHKTISLLVNPWRTRNHPLTLKLCCLRLEAKGIRTFRGRKWSPSRLISALKEVEGT